MVEIMWRIFIFSEGITAGGAMECGDLDRTK
jgi:hypothetical protein